MLTDVEAQVMRRLVAQAIKTALGGPELPFILVVQRIETASVEVVTNAKRVELVADALRAAADGVASKPPLRVAEPS